MANPVSYSTYSFEDVNCIVSHPSVGSFSFNGAGMEVSPLQRRMICHLTI